MTPLGIVHRDVSPQNVMVATDGTSRVLDFGIASARQRSRNTGDGRVKGKVAYMAPEQLEMARVGRAADIFSASVVLCECLTSRRLFDADVDLSVAGQVRRGAVAAPSSLSTASIALDEVVMRGLALDPADRFASAREMSEALERACPPANPRALQSLVAELAAPALEARHRALHACETWSSVERMGAWSSIPEAFSTAPGERDRSDELPTRVIEETSLAPLAQILPARADSGRASRLIRGRVAAGIGACVGISLLGGLWMVTKRAVPVSTVSETEVMVSDTSIPLPPAAPPSATGPGGARVTTVDVIATSRPPESPSPAVSRPRPTSPLTKAARPPPARACDPPYEIDARGIQRIKRQCL